MNTIHKALLLSSLALLGACGGGGDGGPTSTPASNNVSIDTVVAGSGGNAASRASSWEATVDGPQFSLSAARNVQVCVSGTWDQQLSSGGTVGLTLTSVLPVALATVRGPTVDVFGASLFATLRYMQCDIHALPAGTHQLRYLVRVSCDAACLANYVVGLRWQVTGVN